MVNPNKPCGTKRSRHIKSITTTTLNLKGLLLTYKKEAKTRYGQGTEIRQVAEKVCVHSHDIDEYKSATSSYTHNPTRAARFGQLLMSVIAVDYFAHSRSDRGRCSPLLGTFASPGVISLRRADHLSLILSWLSISRPAFIVVTIVVICVVIHGLITNRQDACQ